MNIQVFPAEHFDQKRLTDLNKLPGDLVFQLMQIFVETTPEIFSQLESALKSHSDESVWRSAHALKSSCLNIGAAKLAQICLKIEELGKASEMQATNSFLPLLRSEFSVVLNLFQSLLKNRT